MKTSLKMLSLLIPFALCLGAEAQTPELTATPVPTATSTPTQTPNSVDDYRGKIVILIVEEPVKTGVTYWLLDATLETNVESAKSFPFIRFQSSSVPELPRYYTRWYSQRVFPESFAVISATLEFAPVEDCAKNTDVFIFPFKDESVAGAMLSPME